VVDAAGLERFALFGISQGCASPWSMPFAIPDASPEQMNWFNEL
jgi:hypothetical protein